MRHGPAARASRPTNLAQPEKNKDIKEVLGPLHQKTRLVGGDILTLISRFMSPPTTDVGLNLTNFGVIIML